MINQGCHCPFGTGSGSYWIGKIIDVLGQIGKLYLHTMILNKRPIGHIVHLRKMFKCFQYNFNNYPIISSWKSVRLFIWTYVFETPSPKNALCQVWWNLAPSRKDGNVESFWRRWQQTKFDQKSSLEPSVQKS